MTKAKTPMLFADAKLVLAVFLCLLNVASAMAQTETTQQELPRLAPGQTIEREWEGSQPHLYRLRLETGQYVSLRLNLLAGKFSFNVALLTPDGKRIEGTGHSNDAPDQNFPALLAIASLTGDYTVKVNAVASSRRSNDQPRYAIVITALRAPTEQDKAHVEAWHSYIEAQQAFSLDTAESLSKAKGLLLKSQALFHQAGDAKKEADVLYLLADVCNSLGAYDQAIEAAKLSLAIVRTLGDNWAEANSLMYLGEAYLRLSDYAQALAAFQQALPIWQSQGPRNSWGVGWALHSIATCHYLLGERRKAVEYGEEAFKTYQSVDYMPRERHRGSGSTASNLGKTYLALGEIQKAIDSLNLGLEHWKKAEEQWGEARVYCYFGDLYFSLGDLPAATDNYQQALSKWRISNDPNDIGNVLQSLGRVYLKSGDYISAARCLNEALDLCRKHKQRRGQAESLALLGKLYANTAETARAVEHYQQALAIWRELGGRAGEANTLTDLGETYYTGGDKQTARDYLQQALQLHRAVQSPDGEAQTLYLLARAEHDLGLTLEARGRIEAAISLIESIRVSVVNQELRTSYLASVRDYYEFYVDLLMQRKRGEQAERMALEISERARARSLLESLHESRTDIRQGVDAALLARERELQQLLNGKSEYQVRLLSGKHTAEQAAVVANEIKTIVSQLQETQARIRTASPRYASLTQPQPLTVEQIQRELLDEGTLLLEYALGEERSYLWAVTPTSLTSYELPKRAEIEAQAAQVYELLTERNQRKPDETPRQAQARAARADAELPPQAAALSRMILGPAAVQLDKKRLLVVAQGKLQFIPFGALPEPEMKQGQSVIPLIVNHEIVHLPSASTLAVLRQEAAGRRPASKTIALFADPVFEANDGRLKKTTPLNAASSARHSRDLLRAAEVFGEAGDQIHFRRLENTGWEARQIARLAPLKQVFKAEGFAANRATALSGMLSNYRIVHFASHSILHSAHPELSGIVLSLLDEQGREQDGFLRLHEIYNLKLPADLVVLSACQTGLGKEVKGEGLMSLTRGFMYAGAPRVVVSAWSVQDRASATLMVKFYKHLFSAQKPSPATALRAAQLEMWRNREFAAPYFWGGFVLQGEWR